MSGTLSPRRLYLLRLWLEGERDGQPQWRGVLQHVVSGERHDFRDWETLIALLRATLAGNEADRGRGPEAVEP